jgi:hypothetical protein
MRNLFAIVAQSICYRCVILRNLFAIDAQSMRKRCVTASQSLRSRFVIDV